MDRLGVDAVARIKLAGAFGAHIDAKYAMLLGMIPDCPLDKVTAIGNAAGTGARIALLNARARSDLDEVVRSIEKIETAIEPAFQDHFIGAIAIPHLHERFPNLERRVKLPGPAEAAASDPGPKVSRRRLRKARLAAR